MYEMKHYPKSKEDLIVAYNFGKLLVEQRMNTWTFRFLWMNFTSNPNRKTPYGFNSTTWIIKDISILDKIGFILSGEMHRIK